MRQVTTAVTALRFISFSSQKSTAVCLLFAGVANRLLVYDTRDCENPIVRKDLLPPNFHIHGFSDASIEDYVAVHAGRAVVLFRPIFASDGGVVDVQTCALRFFNDWVWHVSWLTQDPLALIVATGHSTVCICSPNDLHVALCIKADEDELTWAATTFVANQDATLYASSGSSFGDILMWRVASITAIHSYLKSKDENDGLGHTTARLVHRLKGHKGPVMRVLIRDDGRYMASASVDRSVRVWRAMVDKHCQSCSEHGCFEVILTHYGHLARVWDVAFMQPSRQSVISVGEDRSCRIWSHCTSNHQLAVHRPHTGRNVWVVATAPPVPDGRTVTFATGGEDGAIKTRTVHVWDDVGDTTFAGNHSVSLRTSIFSLPGKLQNPRKSGGANDESGRTIQLVTSNDLLVSTDFGRILAARLHSHTRDMRQIMKENDSLQWTQLFCDETGTAFTPCSLVVLNGIICAGQTNGNVIAFPIRFVHGTGIVVTGKAVRFNAFNGEQYMVMGMFSGSRKFDCDNLDDGLPRDNDQLSNDNKSSEEFEIGLNDESEIDANRLINRNNDSFKPYESEIFVASPTGDLYQWSLQCVDSRIEPGGSVEVRYVFVAVYEAHKASKSALVTSVCQVKANHIVAVGDKGGRIHIFRRPKNDYNRSSKIRAERWMRVHDDRVSSITEIDNTHLMSAGFDGRLVGLYIDDRLDRTIEISIEKSERTAERTDTVVGVFARGGAACAVVAGFRGAVLIVWDVPQRAELFRFNVGNWRRAHAVRVTNDNSVTVAFWRAGRLHLVYSVGGNDLSSKRLAEAAGESLTTGGAEFHGGRANDIAWIASDLVISGGEDTMVRVTRIDESTGCLRWVQRLSGHISSVSGVCVAHNGCLAATCGGADEVLIWASNRKDAWHCVLSVNVGKLLLNKDFLNSEHHKINTVDNLSAIMRVTGIDGGWDCQYHNSCIVWVVGRSDGSVTLLHTNKTPSGTWHALGTLCGMHKDGAVLSVSCNRDTVKCDTIVSGGSGGTIAVWTMLGDRTNQWENAHEGGVDCVTVRQLHNGPLIVASGGDDERVRIWPVGERNGWKSDIGDGHHAAVTAITFVEGTDVLVSLGADQLVIFWHITMKKSCLGVRRIWHCYTAIPDGGGIYAQVRQRANTYHIEVVICGYGLEVFDGPSVERCNSDASQWTLMDSCVFSNTSD